MQITANKPVKNWTDRELADFLAVHVMGWSLVSYPTIGGSDVFYWIEGDVGVGTANGTNPNLWNPAVKLHQAFQVLKKFTPKHRSWTMYTHDGTGAEGLEVWCEIRQGNHKIIATGEGGLLVNDDWEDHAVEHAICRAIVSAVIDQSI